MTSISKSLFTIYLLALGLWFPTATFASPSGSTVKRHQAAFQTRQSTSSPESIILPPSTLNLTTTNTTFTGKVYQQPLQSAPHAASAFVTFTPSSRTYWHRHEEGQILHVTAGHGWIADLGGVPRRIEAGDVIWAPPGTTHWHGADEESLLVHLAVGLGKTTWLGEVGEGEYRAAGGIGRG